MAEIYANDLPGVNEEVKNPVTGEETRLFRVIINLNDKQQWTREQIADWLDTLDIPLAFPVQLDNNKGDSNE